MGSQPSREHLGDDTAKKCTNPSLIRFLFIVTIENTILCHTLAAIILWSRHDSNYLICQELSSLLQNHETTIYLYHIAVVVCHRHCCKGHNIQGQTCSAPKNLMSKLALLIIWSAVTLGQLSYRADLDNYEDLIRLSVRRFLSQISSSVPWLTITPVGLCEWIRFVENHTSA